jgi:hypothetical protein
MKTSEDQMLFQQQLLNAESTDAALRAEYERKRDAMFETKLSAVHKVVFMILCPLIVCAVAFIGTMAFTDGLPRRAMIPIVLGMTFALAWVVFFVQVLRRGTIRRRIDPPRAAAMAFAFALTICIAFAIVTPRTDIVLLMGVLFVIPAALNVIRVQIEQAEMRTQERIIELQYRLAVLSERIGGDDDDAAGSMAKI